MKHKLFYIALFIACISMAAMISCGKKEASLPAGQTPSAEKTDPEQKQAAPADITIKEASIEFCNS